MVRARLAATATLAAARFAALTFAFGSAARDPLASRSARSLRLRPLFRGFFGFGDGIRRGHDVVMGSSHSSLDGDAAAASKSRRGSKASVASTAASDAGMDVSPRSEGRTSPSRRPSRRPSSLYVPPSSPIRPLAHYVFLVHGWMGNDLEMGYLNQALDGVISTLDDGDDGDTRSKRVKRSRSSQTRRMIAEQRREQSGEQSDWASYEPPEVVIHSVKCNVGKTHDGIRNGGTRLAQEMVEFIRSDVERRLEPDEGKEDGAGGESSGIPDGRGARDANVTYSLVGNSLGGLYSRYAVSLLPLRLSTKGAAIDLHPNVFCTTATPHLGVSRHTYLPIPRIAETIIGAGMGATGRDLFRLNSEKDLASAAADGVVTAAAGGAKAVAGGAGAVGGAVGVAVGSGVSAAVGAVGGVVGAGARVLPAPLHPKRLETAEGDADRLEAVEGEGDAEVDADADMTNDDAGATNDNEAPSSEDELPIDGEDDNEELRCVIRDMCLQERYLSPLRNFRTRVAYANAYGTDFQVPTGTAAFLNDKSGVGHFVVASRDISPRPDKGSEEKGEPSNNGDDNTGEERREEVPPFIVAVVRTERQSQPQSPTKPDGDGRYPDELLRMSQSLDALGWTKVFVDVRDRIPVPGLAKPGWLQPRCGSLDDLIRERRGLTFASLSPPSGDEDGAGGESAQSTADGATGPSPPAEASGGECILTSQELAQSTYAGDTLHFPLGHTVMVANSKNEKYSQLNSQGRPVMDKLAEDLVDSVLEFE
ncbi:hypothetical protein ACHAWF_008791 [Thalassiosira exigua]